MFQRKELGQLRRQREQLVLQSEANRQRLKSDWQRLQSPEAWLDEIVGLARRHPWGSAGLAAAAGTLLVKTLRRPRTLIDGIGRLAKFAPAAFSLWRWYRRKWRQS